MEKRFSSLRIIGTVLKVLAWVVLIGGILFGLLGMVLGSALPGLAGTRGPGSGGFLQGLALGISMIVGAVLSFLGLYAYGDAVYLALAIEENTREIAHYLKGGDALRRT